MLFLMFCCFSRVALSNIKKYCNITTKLKMSSNYLKLSEDFAIDGGINEESLKYIKENSKSVLYVCTDSATDQGYVLILLTLYFNL